MTHRNYFISALLLLLSFNSLGQKFFWAKDDGERDFSSTSIFKTSVDSNDDIIVFGTVRSRFEYEEGLILNDSTYNYFLAKYSQNGDFIWYKAFGSSGYLSNSPQDAAMFVDDEDRIYVSSSIPSGESINIDGFIADYIGSEGSTSDDFFVARFDPDGNLEMGYRHGADDANVHDISVDADGNIYLAGSYRFDITFEQTHTSVGATDAFLAKIDSEGNPIWSRSEGNSVNSDKSYAVEIAGDDVYWGYYLRLGTDYFTLVDNITSDNDDVWNYTASGTESGYSNSGSDLSVFGSDIYLFGNFKDEISLPTAAGSLLLTAADNNQVFIAKIRDFGSTRNLVWGIQDGFSNYDTGYDIETTSTDVYISKRVSSSFQLKHFSSDDGALQNTLVSDHPYEQNSSSYSLSLLSDGSPIVGGAQSGNLGFGDKILAGGSMFLLRTNATLDDPDWLRGTFNHNFKTKASTHDSHGNMYVVGTFEGIWNDGDEIHYGMGVSDMFIRKYDTKGNIEWVRFAKSKSNIIPSSVEVFGDHLYVVGTYDVGDGSYNMILHEGTTLGGDEDIEGFMIKYSLDGDFAFASRAVSTEGDIDIFDLAISSNEEIYIVGEALGGSPKNFGNGVTKSFSDQGYFLAKYDSEGNAQWADMVNGTGGSVVSVKSTGEVAVGGRFSSSITFHGNSLLASGLEDVFIAYYNPEGTLQWVRQGGGTLNDEITGISFGKNNALFISGYFDDDFAMDGFDLTGDWYEWFIASLTEDGDISWLTGSNGSRRDYAYDLAIDTAGTVFVSGKYEGNMSIGGEDFEGIGTYDVQALILGFDPETGSLVEQVEYGTPTNYDEGDDDDVIKTLSIDQDNNFYITGDFIGEVQLDSITLNDGSNDSFFAARMSLSDCAYVGQVSFTFSGEECAKQIIQFTDESDLGTHEITSYKWDFDDGNFSSEHNPQHTFSDEGTFEVILTITYNAGLCELSTSQTVTVRQAQGVDAGVDIEACRIPSVTLTGTMSGATDEVVWSTLGDGTFDNGSSLTPVYSFGPSDLENDEVELVLSSVGGSCPLARDTIRVNIRDEVTLNVGSDRSICSGDEVSLSATLQGTNEILWSTEGDGTFSEPTALQTTYLPGAEDLTNGSFRITASTSGGDCNSAMDQLTVTTLDSRVAENVETVLENNRAELVLLTNEEISNGWEVLLESSPQYGEASLEAGRLVYNVTDPSMTIDELTYMLRTSCEESTATITFVNNRGDVSVYNVITPNGDGHHDFLKIESIESYPENELIIFDRAGNVIYSTAGYSNENPFNGTDKKGKELIDGNYFYRLKIPELQLDESGFILIKR